MAIGTGFSNLIGTRGANNGEYYNVKTGQGFSNPNDLASFVNQNFSGVNANPNNVFQTLNGNYSAPQAPQSQQVPNLNPNPQVPGENFFTGAANFFGKGINDLMGGISNGVRSVFGEPAAASTLPINTAAKANPVSYPFNGMNGDTLFSNPQQFFQAGGKQDFSNVTTYNPNAASGPASNVQFYKFSNSPNIYQNKNYQATPANGGNINNTGSIPAPSYTGTGGSASISDGTIDPATGQPYSTVSINPDNQTGSTTLGSQPVTNNDIQSILQKNLDSQDAIIQQVTSAMTDPAYAKAQMDAMNAGQAVSNNDVALQGGMADVMKKPIGLEFQQGQEAAITRDNAFTRSSLVNQANYYQNVLNNANTTRQQKIQAASFMYDASRNKLSDTINLYKATAPENIGTNYNPATGLLTATMRNPLTGQVTVQPLGNIGAQKAYTTTNISQLPDGSTVFVGVDAMGNVTTHPLFDAGGQPVSTSGQSITTPSSLNGSFPQGAQTAGSAALVNNVSGLKDPTTGKFASYSDPMQSLAATAQDIANKQAGHTSSGLNGNSTLSQFVNTWITGNPNKQGGYTANDVAGTLAQYGVSGVTGNTPIGTLSPVALAAAIAKHETGFTVNQGASQASAPQQITPEYIQHVVQTLPPQLQSSVNYLPDGTPFFDGNRLADTTQIKLAQTYQSKTGIPYIDKGNAEKLNSIATTQKNLQDFQTLADNTLGSGILGKATNWASLSLQSLFGGTTLNNFNSFRTAAVNAMQSLGSNAGGSFRLTQSEINTAVNNLPTINDSKQQADSKITALGKQLNNWLTQIIPGYKPPTASAGGVDYTAALNQLAGK